MEKVCPLWGTYTYVLYPYLSKSMAFRASSAANTIREVSTVRLCVSSWSNSSGVFKLVYIWIDGNTPCPGPYIAIPTSGPFVIFQSGGSLTSNPISSFRYVCQLEVSDVDGLGELI